MSVRLSAANIALLESLGLDSKGGRPRAGDESRSVSGLLRTLLDRIDLLAKYESVDLPEEEMEAFGAAGRAPVAPFDLHRLPEFCRALAEFQAADPQRQALLRQLAARAEQWDIGQRIAAALRIEQHQAKTRNT